MQNALSIPSGIVLLAKKEGITSFQSLSCAKHALCCKKIGHTGTLDSFAQGLLVLCVGNLTKLASRIVALDKTYKAVIAFGKETDTLEWTGKTTKTSPLPSKNAFEKAFFQFTGNLLQAPPSYSAVHIGGKRASDLARMGKTFDIAKRPITVFSSRIIAEQTCLEKDETKKEKEVIEYALVEFCVSKGTYIRVLASDIAKSCNSCAHLLSLRREKIGSFSLENAAGKNALKDFSIDSAKKQAKNFANNTPSTSPLPFLKTKQDEDLQEEIRKKIMPFSPPLAKDCGFDCVTLKNETYDEYFLHGRKMKNDMFFGFPSFKREKNIAVFSSFGDFIGCMHATETRDLEYDFVAKK